MPANKNQGRLLLKLGLVLVVLAGAAFAVSASLQRTARVKAAKLDTAVDAVPGSVFVDADGGATKELKSEAGGKVVACDKIALTAKFRKGDVLVQLDTTDLDRTIKETTRNFRETKLRNYLALTGGKPELLAKAKDLSDEERAKLFQAVSPERKLAVEKLEQVKRMHDLGNVSDEELANARRALEHLDLSLQVKALDDRKFEEDFQVNMDGLLLQKKRMQIEAPSDGEITNAFVWEGMLIGPGHVVATFMSPERIVTAKISEESFGRVRIGQKANVRLLTYGEQMFEAKVSKLVPKADDAQRFTVFLDVQVDNPEDMLKPGSTGEATITVDQRPDAIMIPRRALFDSDKVYVVKNGRVEKRQVKVGYLALNVAEVLEGIAVGEHVIVDALEEFRPGDRVRVEVLP